VSSFSPFLHSPFFNGRSPVMFRPVRRFPRSTLLPICSSLRASAHTGVAIHSPPGRLGFCTAQPRSWPPGEVDSHASAAALAQNDVLYLSEVERGEHRTNRDISGDRKGRPYRITAIFALFVPVRRPEASRSFGSLCSLKMTNPGCPLFSSFSHCSYLPVEKRCAWVYNPFLIFL